LDLRARTAGRGLPQPLDVPSEQYDALDPLREADRQGAADSPGGAGHHGGARPRRGHAPNGEARPTTSSMTQGSRDSTALRTAGAIWSNSVTRWANSPIDPANSEKSTAGRAVEITLPAKSLICATWMREREESLSTIQSTGTPSCSEAANSPPCISAQPSPVMATVV